MYFILEFSVRKISFELAKTGATNNFLKEYKWEFRKDIVILISPGYWLARYYKDKIKSKKDNLPCHLKKFIKVNNKINLCLSLNLFAILSLLFYLNAIAFFQSLIIWRFISRSFEIICAFSNDVINGHEQQKSSLTKFDRVKLALLSYVEIFFYSACFYLVTVKDIEPIKAFLISLGVGTFTNVNSDLFKCNEILALFTYIQVFTTLSLVVLSLAIYVSRPK
ncbi:hypothetical protein [Thiothrix unzii]|uniref:hypothetical protein n=1 Tax=Thiothrix unzii TaxID=111769 RepID=UPI002A3687A9|nr:hypothetical protein [Thiothrix unzii]MDX9990186.1 hypothetical protein [Thiothrix unzii]